MLFDTQRLAQMGTWRGTLSVAGTDYAVTPDRCKGSRDRSWGVRPVGEPESDGIRQGAHVFSGMWNYTPMQFDDHCIFAICHERDSGERLREEGRRVWLDGRVEVLGRPEHDHTLVPGTRVIERAVIRFPDAGIEIVGTPLLANWFGVGTGYGVDADWRHGKYQGSDPVVQGLVLKVDDVKGLAQYLVVDQSARYEYDGHVGYGLLEHGFFGPFARYGLT